MRKNLPQKSKRLARTMLKGFSATICMLDCYNNEVVTGVSVTISTRIDACNHYYVMNVYEKPEKEIQDSM